MEAGLESIPSFYFSLENPIFLTKKNKTKMNSRRVSGPLRIVYHRALPDVKSV
jgi:hypothetical protein